MIIKNIVPGCRSTVSTGAAVEDDPQRRRPDITVAETHLHWSPKVNILIFFYYTVSRVENN